MGWFAGVWNRRGLRESRCALTLGIAGDPWLTGMRREAPVQSDEQGGLPTVREPETKREDWPSRTSAEPAAPRTRECAG